MSIKFAEPGGDATFNVAALSAGGLWSGVGDAAMAVATDFVHGSHIKSIKCRPNKADFVTPALGVLSDTGSRISFYIYIVTLPSATSSIFILKQTGATSVATLRITTGGVLQLNDGAAGAQLGTNGATLSTGTWYRISLAYTITSTTINRFELFVDGVSSISVTNATLTSTTTSTVGIGNRNGNVNFDLRFSDFYIDDSNSLTDTGDIWVTAKRPISNGTSNQFTTQVGAGGSGYGTGHSPQVNERPSDNTNGWSLSNTTVQTEEYSIETVSQGDMDIGGNTIVDYMGWISAKVDSTSNSPVHHIIVGGTSTAKTMTTSAFVYFQPKGSSVYPSGNTDIGMDAAYTTTPHLTSLLECGIVVAFLGTPTPAPTSTGNMFLVM